MSTEVNSVQNNHPGLKDPMPAEQTGRRLSRGPGPAALSPMTTEIIPVETPQGPGRLFVDIAPAQRSILVLGHGAGGGVNAADLELLARRLPPFGVTVVRFEQPWRTAGRRVAGPPATLDEAWLAALGWIRSQPWGQDPVCSSAAAAPGPGWPAGLRSPWRRAGWSAWPSRCTCPAGPEKSRALELLTAGVPRLVLQGPMTPSARAAEMRAAIGAAPGVRLVELPGADHGFRVAKAATFTAADLRDACAERGRSSSSGREYRGAPALHQTCRCSPSQ